MTGTPEAWVPHFTIGVPLKKTPLERVRVTVESILQQSAVIAGKATLSVRIVASDLDAEVTSWLLEQDPTSLSIHADLGSGLYSAVAQALKDAPGDYFGYLGGGDSFEPTAFALVMDALPYTEGERQQGWVTGLITSRREDGAIVRSLLPYRYRRTFWRHGLHGSILPTVQQESTFWTQDLNAAVDWDRLREFRLAGDFYLWRTFAELQDPIILEAAIGSFRWHGDNMSTDWNSYAREVQALTGRPNVLLKGWAHLERALWALPAPVKWRLSPQVRRFSWPEGPWR